MSASKPTNRPRILFLCTGNCCRSQMAEALFRHMAGSRFEVGSAGSHPAGFIHPLTIETMRRMNVPMDGQFSKSWDEFADVPNDIILTLCDSAASIPCPVWPGHPATAHWSLPDPSFIPGTNEDRLAAADDVARQLEHWFKQLLALPVETLSPQELKSALERIAQA